MRSAVPWSRDARRAENCEAAALTLPQGERADEIVAAAAADLQAASALTLELVHEWWMQGPRLAEKIGRLLPEVQEILGCGSETIPFDAEERRRRALTAGLIAIAAEPGQPVNAERIEELQRLVSMPPAERAPHDIARLCP